MAFCNDMESIQEILDDLRHIINEAQPSFREQYEELKANLKMLVNYRVQGIDDPKRGEIYMNLLDRARHLHANVTMDRWSANFLGTSMGRPVAMGQGLFPIDIDKVRAIEEDFVQQQSMLTLYEEAQRAEKSHELYHRHYRQIEAIFASLLTSYQWTYQDAERFLDLLVSPMCDTNDAQIMLSAIMLNTMCYLDTAKGWLMGKVYQTAMCETVRQRAFVGWAFTLPAYHYVGSGRYDDLCDELIADAAVRAELVELQKQYLLAIDTEKDADKLAKDIIPRIMKGSPYDITPQGLKEKTKDKTEEILNPENDEMRLKEVEEGIAALQKMKTTGMDVNYGSFKSLKGHGFFSSLVNWFTPFYKEHPYIKDAVASLGKLDFASLMIQQAQLCDSDCYSFYCHALRFANFIPEELKNKDMDVNLSQFGIEDPEWNKPANIRRRYLQDLFRFGRLFRDRGYFTHPFDENRTMFPTLFFEGWDANELVEEKMEIVRFLFAQKRYRDFRRAIAMVNPEGRLDCHLMLASYYKQMWDGNMDYLISDEARAVGKLERMQEERVDMLGQAEMFMAEESKKAHILFFLHLEEALAIDKDNVTTLRMMAAGRQKEEALEDAVDLYRCVLKIKPDHKRTILDLAALLLKMGNAKEAANYVFQLSFDQPDNPDVMRLQAWLYMLRRETEKAQPLYESLVANPEQTIDSDLLNMGYCYWFQGDWHKASHNFVDFLIMHNDKDMHIGKHFDADQRLLDIYGVSQLDRCVMEDVVQEKIKQ